MSSDISRRAAPVWLIAWALLLGACAAQTRPDQPPDAPRLQPGIYHVDSGDKLTPDQLYEWLAARDFVVVGESHDVEWHHRIQRDIFAALLERRSDAIALGMEMFERPVQSTLDAYVSGEIDEATMLDRTDWANSWGMDPDLYRPLWQLAHENRAPIVALNVPRRLTRAIAGDGLEGLSDEQRARIPDEIDTGYEAQREYLRDVFGGGEHGSDMNFEYFLQAQATWDETMAETAVEFVGDHEGIEAMMLVTGRAHARRDFGIPPRIVRRLRARSDGDADPVDRVTSVLPFEPEATTPNGPATLEKLRENEAADYIWVREP